MKLALRLGALLLCMLLTLSFDLGFFAASLLPESKSVVEVPEVDVIAVLTGGQGRLKEALNLLMMGKGKRLLISGVEPQAKISEIFLLNGLEVPPPDVMNFIHLDVQSLNTHENAIEIRRVMELYDAHSVLLVTSSYHLKRATLYLERELKKEPPYLASISNFPVESPNFDRRKWWSSPTSWSILLSEYLKSFPARFGDP